MTKLYTQIINNDNNMYYEYKYNIIDIEINFEILLDTINSISNKLYIEWINVQPITINNYKNTELYKNTWKFNEENQKYEIK